ncbi:MAG TPA: polymer-forming cytoskeletal protein [Candidatus Nitrosopolaris sp.]|nr:polymer-forming cytoskeletal protein [Candidatus Nitrosopolaris sp.]
MMWGNRGDRVGAFLDDGNEIVGKYTCSGTVMLDARLRGEITANDTLVIGDHGVVEATVRAVVLVIRGKLIGKATASERVELKSSARVTGDVEAPVIVVEEGAVLDGQRRTTKLADARPSHFGAPVAGY